MVELRSRHVCNSKTVLRIILFLCFTEQVYVFGRMPSGNASIYNQKPTQTTLKKLAVVIPDNYSRLFPPKSKFRPQMQIWFSVHPHMVRSLSEISMDFTLDVTLHFWWSEPRIKATYIPDIYILPIDLATQLWYPRFTLTNCKGCEEDLIDPNKHKIYLTKNPFTEYVAPLITYRKTFSFTCLFDLSRFPFDQQKCHMDVQFNTWYDTLTFNTTLEKLKYKKIHTENFTVPAEFQLTNLYVESRTCTDSYGMGKAICTSYVYIFKRTATQHIFLTFVPSMLIVIISWISFWLDAEATAPRTALGLTSLLTLATQLNYAQRNLPAVGTIKALDFWMFVCISMVFASLIVFAISYTYRRVYKQREATHLKPFKKQMKMIKSKKIQWTLTLLYKRVCMNLRKNPDIIDDTAKLIFPLAFLSFNIFFWWYYYY